MTECKQLASYIVRRHASFDSDQAPRHIGDLAAGIFSRKTVAP
jgi:hypothetical protein